MALIFIDGFDHYVNTEQMVDCDYIIGSHSWCEVGSDFARFTGGGLRGDTFSGYAIKDLGVNKSTIYFGAATKKAAAGIPTLSSTACLLYFLDESDVHQVRITVNPNYGINAYQGDNTLLGSSADNVFRDQRWEYLEVKIIISATVGEVTAKVNGVQVLNLTSQDTKNGSDYIRKFQLNHIYGTDPSYWDDLYVDDAQFHGDCRIRTFVPDSISSANNDFTASAGNKDECVDEVLSNEDTDYITSDTLNHKQTFGITTGSLGTVIGIQVKQHCRLDEAGSRKITALCRSNSTNYSGTETDFITADWHFEIEIWDTDPDDSNVWTQTKLEAAEFGLEITT